MAKKSLGTLTLDIVAQTGGFTQGMSKAERASKKWRKEVEGNLKHTGQQLERGLKVSATAAAAAFGALTAATIQQARAGLESVDAQAKLARSLNTTYDSVTALQIAFEEGGVDAFEASLNRMNRRLGAAEAGTGAAAKTVEALNLNLSELSQLEADERIARIADAIVESGVSAQRAARFVQDLGFEQKEATQLFLQGGDAIRGYRQQVDEFGLSMSELDTAMVEKANDDFARAGRLFDAIGQQLAVNVAPILSAVADLFIENAKEAGGLGEATADAFNVFIEGTARALNALDRLDRGFLSTKAAVDVFAVNVRIGLLEVAREIVEIPTHAVNEMIRVINDIPGINIDALGMSDFGRKIQGVIDESRQEIEKIDSELRERLSKPLPGDQFERFVYDARSAAEKAARAAIEINESATFGSGVGAGGEAADEAADLMREYQNLVRELQTDEERLSSQLRERLELLDAVGVATEQDYSRAAAGAFQDAPDVSGLSPEIGGAFGELNKIDEEQERLEEWYSTHLEMLAGYREQRADLSEQWNEQERQLEQEHQDKLLQIESARQQAQLAAAESVFGNLADVTATFAGEQSALYKTMFAVQKAAAIAQSIVAIQQGIAMAAANPWPANLGAMASVAAATAGIISNIQSVALTGMAHDGIDSVPQEGTWLLDKGERVLSSPQADNLDQFLASQKGGSGGGGTTVNVIEDKRRAGQTETTTDSEGRENVNVFVSDVFGRGPRAKAMEQVYGLKRQGR